jgi:DNA mismatch endonuclease (patch repair protein)
MRYKSFASTSVVRERMQKQARFDTGIEMCLRRKLHRMGLRFRLNARPVADFRCRTDLVFRPSRVAVEIRGCFWHACSAHGMIPTANARWWTEKFRKTVARDERAVAELTRRGWLVVVVWEHDDLDKAAGDIAHAVLARRPQRTRQ